LRTLRVREYGRSASIQHLAAVRCVPVTLWGNVARIFGEPGRVGPDERRATSNEADGQRREESAKTGAERSGS